MRLMMITLTALTSATLAAAVNADDTLKRSAELQVLDRFVCTWNETTQTMSFIGPTAEGNKFTSTHQFIGKSRAEASGKVTTPARKLIVELSWNQTRRKDAPTSKAKSRGSIGFSTLTKTNPYFAIIGETMAAEAKQHGYGLIWVSAEFDAAKQAGQIDEFIAEKVVAIVLNPCDSKSIGPAIKRANDAGIPVFTNDVKHSGDLGKVACHIATDNHQGGRLAGKAMVDAIGKSGGKVAILHFPPVEACRLRVKGFNELLAKHNTKPNSKKIEVVATLDGGGSRQAGFRAAMDAIQRHPDLAALFAINDPSALGAYAALQSAGQSDQVTIIGFDGEAAGKQAILEGKILCDPVQSPAGIGRATVESIVKYIGGKDVDAEILIPTKLYYKTDAEKDPTLKK